MNTASFLIPRGRSGLAAAIAGALTLALFPAASQAQVGNTATGIGSLPVVSTGTYDTADGFDTLNKDTVGSFNTATGANALLSNVSGNRNTAGGFDALYHNTGGVQNTAMGNQALFDNTSGNYNTASGFDALYHNTSGADNTAGGFNALANSVSGSNNIALGSYAGYSIKTGSNNIDIGNECPGDESNTIRIGTSGTATYIAGISGAGVTGLPVVVNGSGQLGITLSSARYKQDIHSMDAASSVLLSLKPVTFRYKPQIDPQGTPQFGLVAEEVEKVCPALVIHDTKGRAFTVRYDAVNALLLNEFLKEHKRVEEETRKVGEQEAVIDKLEAAVARQQKELAGQQKVSQEVFEQQQQEIKELMAALKEQASQLRKVSGQAEAGKSAPGMVANNE